MAQKLMQWDFVGICGGERNGEEIGGQLLAPSCQVFFPFLEQFFALFLCVRTPTNNENPFSFFIYLTEAIIILYNSLIRTEEEENERKIQMDNHR